MLHLTVAGVVGIIFSWWGAMAILCNSRLSFDMALNLFRGLPVDYTSPSPKSIVDQVEQFLFKKNGILPKIIYLVGTISANLIYYYS